MQVRGVAPVLRLQATEPAPKQMLRAPLWLGLWPWSGWSSLALAS